jgi:hypothetical protein
MPIPPFDHNGVLPPYSGTPASRADVSPYRVTLLEVCERWGNDQARREILSGLLELREALRVVGITQGFQWLDGSFMEDVETIRGRPPQDIDVVTFFTQSPYDPADAEVQRLLPILRNHRATKTNFHTDHFLVPLQSPPERLVDDVRYWSGLFSHRRADDVWKGMLRVELGVAADDTAAEQHLAKITLAAP